MGVTLGGDSEKKWQELSFIRFNAHETIVETRYAQPDKLDSIQKRK